MKKTITTILIAITANFSYSQTNQQNEGTINEIKCKLTVEEIFLKQPLGIGDPSTGGSKEVARLYIQELNLIYYKEANNISFDEHIKNIDALIKVSEKMGMNYSMFKEDLDYINSIK